MALRWLSPFLPGGRALRSCAVVLHLLVLWAAVAPAQLYVGADVTLASPYVWRGLTRANVGALAPELFLTAELHGYLISAGRWWIYEPGATSQRLSDLPPGGMRFAESDWWVQGARRFGFGDLSLGFICYKYRDTLPATVRPAASNTWEVYGTLRKSGWSLAPGVSAYLDVKRVHGAYLEAFEAFPVFGNPFAEPSFWVVVGGLVGYSAGQEVNPADSAQAAYFARSGFTHADLSFTVGWPFHVWVLPIQAQFEFHTQFSIDSFTRRTSPGAQDRSARVFAKLSLRSSPRVARW